MLRNIEQPPRAEGFPATRDYFEIFRAQLPDEMSEAKNKGDSKKVHELEERRTQIDTIIGSLDAGDPGPSRDKIVSMIEENVKWIREVPPGKENRGGTLVKLATFLSELDAPHSAIDVSKAEPRNQIEGQRSSNEERAGFEDEITGVLDSLDSLEERVGKALSEIRDEKARIREYLRGVALQRLRKQIAG